MGGDRHLDPRDDSILPQACRQNGALGALVCFHVGEQQRAPGQSESRQRRPVRLRTRERRDGGGRRGDQESAIALQQNTALVCKAAHGAFGNRLGHELGVERGNEGGAHVVQEL